MSGQGAIITRIRTGMMLALLLCALAARTLVPAGWMPATTGAGYSITLCTGTGAMAVWVDGDGTIHKNKPATGDHRDQPCAFAGLLHAAALPDMLASPAPVRMLAMAAGALPVITFAIGRGLAAPPPPPTGPPAIL